MLDNNAEGAGVAEPDKADSVNDEYWLELDACVNEMLARRDVALCGVLISGYTGSGKTFFAETYLKRFENSHPVLIARHHQLHVGVPYFGFKYSLSDYLSKIYRHFSRQEFREFSAKMKESLGDSFPLLLDYIPELSLINSQEPGAAQRSVPKIENQLYPLFRSLFEFLADFYRQPVIFFTDDLQWIDISDINLLKYLLLNLSPEKLVWVGAYRNSQSKISSLSQFSEELAHRGRRIEHISLKGLNLPQVKIFVETMLGNACHQDVVNICFELSGGNPSYLQVLAESLKNSGLVWLDEGEWQCEKSVVRARYKGQNTGKLLMARMHKLSATTRGMLSIMACMGIFSRRTITDWLKDKGMLIEDLVTEACEAGLLEEKENTFRFSEMYLSEMIYNDLTPGHRSELHYKIGKLIYERGLDNLRGTQLILMTTHLNQSLNWIRVNGEQQLCAELNYKAGNFSKQDNAPDQARYFFKMSADLLKECPWEQVWEQVWLVYLERAKVEYNSGEYDLAEIHLDYLLERLSDPLKRARVFESKVIINNHLGRYRRVVQILNESLRELGVELPLKEEVLHAEIGLLKQLLGESDSQKQQEVVGTTDTPTHDAILKLLNVGGMSLHHTSDVLMTWAALQIIIRSGLHPASGVKAIGYVSYARMLIIAGEIEKGVEFGKKGVEINNALEDINLRCRVYGVFAFYIQPWKRAFADSMPLLEHGIEAGRKAGDLIGLYILKTHKLNIHFLSGLPLTELLEWNFEESYPGMELTYYITHYQKSLVKFLVGESAVFSIPRQQPSWMAAKLTIQEEKFYRNYVWARYYFLFGHYELAERAAREANENRKLQEGSPLVPANLLIWCLSITQNWANYPQEALPELTSRIEEILESLELWCREAPLNYEASCWLVKAEWESLQQNEVYALSYYYKALEAAAGNVYWRAVTNELLAKFLLKRESSLAGARTHLLQAVNCFSEWGALAKAKQITQQYQTVLSADNAYQQEMDIETIQHELSGDLEVGSLVKKLMVLLLRISGSTRVVVELVKGVDDQTSYLDLPLLNGTAESSAKKNTAEILDMPASMVLMAHQSEHIIIVNNLDAEKGLRDLATIRDRGIQSFLILPININGHLSMVIYLENRFAKDWYVQERVKWVRITANQGAVILENAIIHEKSVQLNEEIRKKMAEKEQLATYIEAQKDAHLKELVQMQEKERKRIASDLHDSLGSMLSSVKLRLNGLEESFSRDFPDKTSRFDGSMNLLNDAIQEVRRIAHNMSPVSLSRFGLKAALQSFLEQIGTSQQMEVDLQILGFEERLPDYIEVGVYRICQELVQNVIKHAGASLMRIQLINHMHTLNLIVEDNGKGMNQDDISSGFGFNTIQSRINLFKGTFAVESQRGKGTMVLIDIPLPRP
jgi:signal transduction histidine kinase/predicted ATPase